MTGTPSGTLSGTVRGDVRRIASLAWPVLIGQLAIIAFGVIDTAMVGRYSALDLAALGLGSSIYVSVYISLTGILSALQPVAAQLYGARRDAEIGENVRQAFWLALVLMVVGCAVLYFPGPLLDLAHAYPQCVTFAVDGIIGATPETLARTDGTRVSARVLAGSAARGDDPVSDRAAAEALASSRKDVEEHAFAVESLLAALRPLATDLRADPEPFRLQLPNLWHLATDVQATLPAGTTSLDVADALHPTAAVAGTPTDVAVRLVAELEGVDRGRYAGPVGWLGANGDGEWMLALRSARITPDGTVRAWAGAGIVAGSVPEREVAETALKFRPITDALA